MLVTDVLPPPQDTLRVDLSKYKHRIIIFRTLQGYLDHFVEKKKHLTPELKARLWFLCFGKTPFICAVLFQGHYRQSIWVGQ